MEPKSMDLKNCTIKFVDGTTPTPFELEIKVDDGNLTWSARRNVEVKRDRGELDYLKEGDEEPCQLSLECRFAAVKSSSGDPVTPFEFLTKTGNAAAYKSTGDNCAIDTIDIVVEVDQDCGTSIEDEVITFSEFAYEEIGGDFRAGTLSVSGICNSVLPTAVRTTLV